MFIDVCLSRLEICTRRSETTRELWSATAKEAPSEKVNDTTRFNGARAFNVNETVQAGSELGLD